MISIRLIYPLTLHYTQAKDGRVAAELAMRGAESAAADALSKLQDTLAAAIVSLDYAHISNTT